MSQPAASLPNKTLPGEPLPDVSLARMIDGLRDARVGLLIGLLGLAVLFRVEVLTAIRTWYESTAYNHCFLVIPIAAYLLWDRRTSLTGLTAAPIPLAALAAVPLGFAWLAAERLGIMEGRQLVLITLVEVLLLTLLGWRLWWAMLGPLLYLYFLVPFGEFLTPKLQDITTLFIRHGVDILHIPAFIDGYTIDIPEGSFFVAEACAGLRFLIASIAFGVLYALIMYRSPVRQTCFIVVSIIVPIIANGFRALGIVYLGHILGSAEAAAADHILYGWIFFSLVILLLIALGLPFRQDEQMTPPTTRPMAPDPRAPRMGLIAGIAATVAAAMGPMLALGLDRAAAASPVAVPKLSFSPACHTVTERAVPNDGQGGVSIIQRVDCSGELLDIFIKAFSPRSTAAPVNAERRRLTRHPDAEDTTEFALSTDANDPVRAWRVARSHMPNHVSVVGLWINGEPANLGLTTRLTMAMTSVTGAAFSPVLVAITPVADWSRMDLRGQRELENKLALFIRQHPEITTQVREFAKTR